MTKADFIDWKNHPVTKEIFRNLELRIQELQEMLSASAGTDPVQDRRLVGAIAAYRDILQIEIEDDEETQ